MSKRWLRNATAVYHGVRVTYHSSWAEKGECLLSTTDPDLARALNFSPSDEGRYRKWVSMSEVEDFIEETWWGFLEGRKVLLEAEDGNHFWVYTASASLADRWNLEQIDKHDFSGPVPKTAFSSTWCERKPIKL